MFSDEKYFQLVFGGPHKQWLKVGEAPKNVYRVQNPQKQMIWVAMGPLGPGNGGHASNI